MSQKLHEQLTYIIPTRNRPHFLRRLLTYMNIMNEKAVIQIFDSSQPEDQERNRILVEEFGQRLNLYYNYVDLPVIAKCRHAVEQVATPYLAFCADDDFLLSDEVYSCVDFLSHAPDYTCAQGIMVSLITDQQNRCTKLRGYSIEDDSPLKRFQRLATNWYTTFYSVYRTSVIIKAYQITDDNCDEIRALIFPEILLSQMCVLLGKVKFFPRLYILRQEHRLNESLVTPNVVDQENVQQLYDDFRNCLAVQLSETTAVNLNFAKSEVDKYYEYYRDGLKAYKSKKKTFRFRLKREINRLIQQFHDVLYRDAILQRRRLSLTSPLCSNEAWRTAHQLMVKFPNGIDAIKTK